jgi:hypothetical protein
MIVVSFFHNPRTFERVMAVCSSDSRATLHRSSGADLSILRFINWMMVCAASECRIRLKHFPTQSEDAVARERCGFLLMISHIARSWS